MTYYFEDRPPLSFVTLSNKAKFPKRDLPGRPHLVPPRKGREKAKRNGAVQSRNQNMKIWLWNLRTKSGIPIPTRIASMTIPLSSKSKLVVGQLLSLDEHLMSQWMISHRKPITKKTSWTLPQVIHLRMYHLIRQEEQKGSLTNSLNLLLQKPFHVRLRRRVSWKWSSHYRHGRNASSLPPVRLDWCLLLLFVSFYIPAIVIAIFSLINTVN